jgi:hypothetical protein
MIQSSPSTFGITSQHGMDHEAFDFLSFKSRGLQPFSRPDGSCLDIITEAHQFGFKSVPIWEHVSMFNCKQVELQLQQDYEHLLYPQEILWKESGARVNYYDKFNPCKMYLTFSKEV